MSKPSKQNGAEVRITITGAPSTGKSVIAACLRRALRAFSDETLLPLPYVIVREVTPRKSKVKK